MLDKNLNTVKQIHENKTWYHKNLFLVFFLVKRLWKLTNQFVVCATLTWTTVAVFATSSKRFCCKMLSCVVVHHPFLRPTHLQSVVSSVSWLSLFLRPSIVVAVDIPVLEVAVDTISVAMATCRFVNFRFWLGIQKGKLKFLKGWWGWV